MRSKKFFLPISLLFILILAFIFDKLIVLFFAQLRQPTLLSILSFITSPIFIFILLILLGGYFFLQKQQKKILPFGFNVLCTLVVGIILKFLFQRLRPYQEGIVEIALSSLTKTFQIGNFSFPSNHAAVVFCILPFLWKMPSKIKYAWLGFAIIVGLSRVYFGVHYLSDVLFGAIIGLTIGSFFARRRTIV